VLDFMHPLRTGRHRAAEGRQAGVDEASGVASGSAPSRFGRFGSLGGCSFAFLRSAVGSKAKS
jgi:hypothetical protein